jgi:hypothetical protein
VIVSLCALLWSHPGKTVELHAYEDRVLAFVPAHAGRVVHRMSTDGADGQPHEVQFFEFESQAALDGYLNDERRLALSAQRDEAIARTELSYLRPAP